MGETIRASDNFGALLCKCHTAGRLTIIIQQNE
jgi:hypothetical protein